MRNRMIGARARLAIVTGTACAAAVIWSGGGGAALGQTPINGAFGVPASQQINNPVVSPFLTLAQPGINPGIAYQTLVSPQIQLGNAVASQQLQIGSLQQAVSPTKPLAQLPGGAILETGHPTSFMNTLNYFPLAAPRH